MSPTRPRLGRQDPAPAPSRFDPFDRRDRIELAIEGGEDLRELGRDHVGEDGDVTGVQEDGRPTSRRRRIASQARNQDVRVFAREVGDRILFFDGGLVVEEARPSDFFTEPLSDRGKLFLSQIL